MDALNGCFALFLLFAGWIVVGIVNVFLLEHHSMREPYVTLALVSWLVSGPTWAFLFLRWRGKRGRAAAAKVQEDLLGKTREHLQNRPPKD